MFAVSRPRNRARATAAALAFGLCAVSGCASESESTGGDAEPGRKPRERAMRDGEKSPDPARPALCDRGREDAVIDVFCAATPPSIRSLADLQDVLELDPNASVVGGMYTEPTDGNSDFAAPASVQGLAAATIVTVLGHSTALSGHLVSPINPRLLILGQGTLMAFQRGVQKVEVITAARDRPSLNFYLFEFEQACNRRDDGCAPGDLYTPRVESDWLSVTVSDDEDLANTPQDCRQCHQRQREVPRLLMRELNNPWTHFFEPTLDELEGVLRPGVRGIDLTRDYLEAKGDERYGNFSLENLTAVAPFLLETAVGADQPVFFDAPGIENERWPYDPSTKYPTEPRSSPTWESAYEAFKRGEQLALPYLETRVSDLEKQAQLSAAYARYRAEEIGEDELPSLADVFPDDPMLRARIGLQTEPDASPVEALIQACGSCHNDVLDQSITRARFNVNLWAIDPREIELAIARIERDPTEPGAMPPPEARQLDPGARERLLAYLRDEPHRSEPDERLVRAAELGMAGGARRRPSR